MNSLRIVDKLLCLESTKSVFKCDTKHSFAIVIFEGVFRTLSKNISKKTFWNVIIFAKCLVMDIWQGFKYVSDILKVRSDIKVKMPKFS